MKPKAYKQTRKLSKNHLYRKSTTKIHTHLIKRCNHGVPIACIVGRGRIIAVSIQSKVPERNKIIMMKLKPIILSYGCL